MLTACGFSHNYQVLRAFWTRRCSYCSHSLAANHGCAHDSQLSTCTTDFKLGAWYWHLLVKVFQLLFDMFYMHTCIPVPCCVFSSFYRIVMPFNSDCWVTEWGRTPQHPLTTYTVCTLVPSQPLPTGMRTPILINCIGFLLCEKLVFRSFRTTVISWVEWVQTWWKWEFCILFSHILCSGRRLLTATDNRCRVGRIIYFAE